MSFAEDAVSHEGDAAKVVLPLGELGELTIEVEAIDHRCSVPHSGKVESCAVGTPYELIDIAIECAAYKALLASGEIHHVEAVPVALVSIAFHALPSDHGAIGRVLRIGVIAHVIVRSIGLADVLGLSCLYII